jgi:hypothetical protein
MTFATVKSYLATAATDAMWLKGNERISAKVQEIVGPAAERAEV